jgi:hypothetical protein
MKKVYFVISVCIILTFMLFAGCASTSHSSPAYDSETGYAEKAPAVGMDLGKNEAESPAEEQTVAQSEESGGQGVILDSAISILEPSVDRKIIYTGSIETRTKNFDEDYKKIRDSLIEAGGYIENAYVYGTKPQDWKDEGRYAEITLRVPSDKFDALMSMLNGLGKNISSSISGEDISLTYFDTETKLSTLRIREERLQKLWIKQLVLKILSRSRKNWPMFRMRLSCLRRILGIMTA